METIAKGVSNGPIHAGGTLVHAVERAGAGAHGAIDSASSGAHKAVDKMATAASHAAENLGATGERLIDAETRALDKARGYVREHPLAALGIAAATGFLLSRLLRSR